MSKKKGLLPIVSKKTYEIYTNRIKNINYNTPEKIIENTIDPLLENIFFSTYKRYKNPQINHNLIQFYKMLESQKQLPKIESKTIMQEELKNPYYKEKLISRLKKNNPYIIKFIDAACIEIIKKYIYKESKRNKKIKEIFLKAEEQTILTTNICLETCLYLEKQTELNAIKKQKNKNLVKTFLNNHNIKISKKHSQTEELRIELYEAIKNEKYEDATKIEKEINKKIKETIKYI